MGSKLSKCFTEKGVPNPADLQASTLQDLPKGSFRYSQIVTADEEGICIQIGTYFYKNIYRAFCPIDCCMLKWCEMQFFKVDEDSKTVTCYMQDQMQVKLEFDFTAHGSTSFDEFLIQAKILDFFDPFEDFQVEGDVLSSPRGYQEPLYQSYELLDRKTPIYYIHGTLPEEDRAQFLEATYKNIISDQVKDEENNFEEIRKILQENGISVNSTSMSALVIEFLFHSERPKIQELFGVSFGLCF